MPRPSALCPPSQQTSFDMRNVADCRQMLGELYQAYVNLLSGHSRIVVRFNERWSEYQKSNTTELLTLYTTMYSQCPAAATSGLPNLNPGNRSKRGSPARSFLGFPRL